MITSCWWPFLGDTFSVMSSLLLFSIGNYAILSYGSYLCLDWIVDASFDGFLLTIIEEADSFKLYYWMILSWYYKQLIESYIGKVEKDGRSIEKYSCSIKPTLSIING